MDETAGALVLEDGEEGPGDSDRTREVALGRRKSVGSGGRLKEEESEEDEDFRPDAGTCGNCIDAECFEGGEENEHGRPAVVEREGQVNEDLVGCIARLVMLLDDVVNMRHRTRDKERKDEG